MNDETWEIIKRFGMLAGATKHSTENWKHRNRVAYKWRLPILEAAKKEGVYLPPEIFEEETNGPAG